MAAEHEELRLLCDEVQGHTENGQPYLHLRALRLPPGCQPAVVDALLCPGPREGYPTRLFVSQPISSPTSKAGNWTAYQILGRTWHSWSWRDVVANQRPVEMLAAHLRAFV
jgi:hypothetical protein